MALSLFRFAVAGGNGPAGPRSYQIRTGFGRAFYSLIRHERATPTLERRVSKHSRWIMSRTHASLEVMALQKQINDLKEAAVAQRRLEMALRDAADFARAVLDDSPFPLCRLAADGKVVYANEAMVGFLGYGSRKELIDLVPILGMLCNGEQLTGICQTVPDPPGFVETTGLFRLKDGSARPGQLRLRRGAQKPDFTLAIISEAPGT